LLDTIKNVYLSDTISIQVQFLLLVQFSKAIPNTKLEVTCSNMKLHYLYLKENESMVMIFIPFGQYSVSLIIGTTSVIRKVKSLLNSRGDSSEFLKPGILNI